MRDREGLPAQTYHKEEMPARIKADAQDRNALREKVELSIDPLDPDQHQYGLVNVVTGKVVVHPSVNVNNAVTLGENQMETFEKSWPGGFHDTITKTVNTMAITRKHLKVGEVKVFDTETIYARAMRLQSDPRSLDADSIMAHELSPYPTSMFDADGQMREAKTKANLKNAIKVEVSSRNAEKDAEASFLDGCAILWVVPWPTSGTVQDYLDRFRSYIQGRLKTDVYLVFDRYKADSTKDSTRQGRDKGASSVYTLRCTTRLPPEKVILTVTRNKMQLIDLICEDMASHKDDFTQHKLVLTGSDHVPVEINSGVIIKRQDMKTTQEETDTIIVQQVAEVKAKKVLVVADDADIFVLLLHFCCQGDIPASTSVLMVSPIHGRAVIDINATVDQHHEIIPDLLAAHGLTGCDIVATYFGIGKAVALRVLRAGVHALSYIGDTSRVLSEITSQATPFILACYGQTKCTSLTEARHKMWASKVGRSVAGAPECGFLASNK
uniref:uncharacterized protein n=1 Tax=Myxine glutinosa TaxID=7769 RepID=UPI00359005F2